VTATVSEAQARAMLQVHPGDGLEAWLADQPWRAAEDGSWRVEPDCEGWTYRVEGMLEQAVRVVTHAPKDGAVTSWVIAP
jgi:hypothetical protein